MTLSPCSISVERSNQPTNQTEEETDRGSVQRVPRVLCSRRRPRSVRGRRPGPAPGMAWCPRRRGLRVPLFSGRFPRRISGRSRELANRPQASRPRRRMRSGIGRASHPLPRPSAATLYFSCSSGGRPLCCCCSHRSCYHFPRDEHRSLSRTVRSRARAVKRPGQYTDLHGFQEGGTLR